MINSVEYFALFLSYGLQISEENVTGYYKFFGGLLEEMHIINEIILNVLS